MPKILQLAKDGISTFGCLLLEGRLVKANLYKSLGALGVAAVPVSPGSAPNWPVSLPWVRRGVHSSDLPVSISVTREKDSPWILKVQECGLEPRGPVPWT